jgi:single-strand DNA-binding protein
MSIGLNKVCLLGHVGKKPEIRTMQSGKEVASFSLATSDAWTDKESKERKVKTEWHRVVVFSEGLVKIVKSYIEQGSKLYIEGSLRTTKWSDAENTERTTTEVVLQGYSSVLLFLDSKEKSTSQPPVAPPVEDKYPLNEDERK